MAARLLLAAVPLAYGLISPPGGGNPRPEFRGNDPSMMLELSASRGGAQWFKQKINHFDPNSNTFEQKYFVDDSNYRQDGPVYLYINGEAPCYGAPSGNALIGILAKETGGMVLALEHRYYGDSQPFADISTDSLRHLNTAQALLDIANFRNAFEAGLGNTTRGREHQWVVFGGSYAGDLAAWFRQKFPHLAVGALASSAPVEPILDYTQFDQQIAKALSEDCKGMIRTMNAEITNQLNTGGQTAYVLKQTFDAAELNDDDFSYLAADAVAIAVQYGYKYKLCDPLARAAPAGARAMIGAFAGYAKSTFYPTLENGKSEVYARDYLSNSVITTEKNARQWLFQQCTELGWFQNSPAGDTLRLERVNLAYFKGLCKSAFGRDLWPDTATTRLNYQGTDMTATNIMFTFGRDDPWQSAGNVQPKGSNCEALIVDCEGCSHCVDLGHASYGEAPQLSSARRQIIDKVKGWLATDAQSD